MRRAMLIATASAIVLTTTGCDQAQGVVDKIRGAHNVPSKIADACLTIYAANSSWPIPHGFKLGELIAAMEAKHTAEDVKWEKTANGYIWRWAAPNQLKAQSQAVAIEFALQEAQQIPAYVNAECGPELLQATAGIVDGLEINGPEFVHMFTSVAHEMHKEREDAQATSETASPQAQANHQVMAAASATPAIIDQRWLIGTWGPAEYNPDNNPSASCDTDSVVTFKADGSYADGGGYGRFRTDGSTITYFDRVLTDDIAGTTDRSQFNNPQTNQVERVDRTSMREQGQLLRRCTN